ncbi:MAG TPA: MaoC family dehydratase [Burkholderiales bacterium]|nr:MaoC family dehydratase [Burkholderiales bacterium]
MEDESQLYFDDLQPGQLYPGQTAKLSAEEFRLFARITGDAHPIHYDAEYAARTRFGKPVAHGLLVMAMTALGATPLSGRLREAMVAFVEQDCRFLKPVLVDDSVRTELEVERVERKSGGLGYVRFIVRAFRGDGEVALVGHHSYLLKCRST